jgi:hypothetical protein
MIVRFLLSKIERRNLGARGMAGLRSNRPIEAGSTYPNRHFCQQLQFGGLFLPHAKNSKEEESRKECLQRSVSGPSKQKSDLCSNGMATPRDTPRGDTGDLPYFSGLAREINLFPGKTAVLPRFCCATHCYDTHVFGGSKRPCHALIGQYPKSATI